MKTANPPVNHPVPVMGLESAYYLDSSVYETAREEIFFKHWLLACHVSQIENPGDFIGVSLLGEEIFVIRGDDGILRAFYNVCRHRGHRLVAGSGNKRQIVCPYHAWTYTLDGALKHAPHSDKVAGFDPSAICLPCIRLEEFLGFVFINLDPDCPDLDQAWPGVRDALLELAPDIENRKLAHVHHADEGCNWLIAVENYNECYHCNRVHKQFSRGVIDPGSYNIVPFGTGKVLRHSARASGSKQAWYDTSGSDYGSFFLWPCSSIQVYPSGLINTYHWRPVAADETRVYRSWYSRDGNIDETLKTVIELDRDTTFSEDLQLVCNVQRGVSSRGYSPGPLILNPQGGINNELSIAMLHQWTREAIDPHIAQRR